MGSRSFGAEGCEESVGTLSCNRRSGLLGKLDATGAKVTQRAELAGDPEFAKIRHGCVLVQRGVDVADEVADVAAAVEEGDHGLLGGVAGSGVVGVFGGVPLGPES